MQQLNSKMGPENTDQLSHYNLYDKLIFLVITKVEIDLKTKNKKISWINIIQTWINVIQYLYTIYF